MKIKLSKPFAPDAKVDEFDVKQLKKALNRLGYYAPPEKAGIIGIPDRALFIAIKNFQTDQGLAPTGTLKPGDETEEKLSAAATAKKNGKYIWRTVGDDRVRPGHAALDGTVRDLSDSPDPGEEINCRCWADAFKNPDRDPPIPKAKPTCDEEQAAYEAAVAEFQTLNEKRQNLENELSELHQELNRLEIEFTNSLGGEFMPWLIGTPLPGGARVEIPQKIIGQVADVILQGKLEKLRKQREKILEKIENTTTQLKAIIVLLENAQIKVEKTKIEWEICKNRIHD